MNDSHECKITNNGLRVISRIFRGIMKMSFVNREFDKIL